MLKATARTSRIAAQLQRSLATLLLRGVKDPRVGNATITAVEVANDLSYARVHVLPFASGQSHKEADQEADKEAGKQLLTGLRSAAGYLRGELARELKLRHMPRLEFQLDIVLEGARRLSSLIDSAIQSDRSRGVPSATEGDEDT